MLWTCYYCGQMNEGVSCIGSGCDRPKKVADFISDVSPSLPIDVDRADRGSTDLLFARKGPSTASSDSVEAASPTAERRVGLFVRSAVIVGLVLMVIATTYLVYEALVGVRQLWQLQTPINGLVMSSRVIVPATVIDSPREAFLPRGLNELDHVPDYAVPKLEARCRRLREHFDSCPPKECNCRPMFTNMTRDSYKWSKVCDMCPGDCPKPSAECDTLLRSARR